MAKVVTPSSITPGQIGKIQELLSAGLRKSGLLSESVQRVIETQGDALVVELVSAIRRRVDRVEATSDLVVCYVKMMDRTRAPQHVLDATGCQQHANPDVVREMPHGEGEEVEIHFFKVGRYISDNGLEKEFGLRGLKPADPYSLAAVNEAERDFADDHPNGTHWDDSSGEWCCIAFRRWGGKRSVYVDRPARSCGWWRDDWWFAGIPQ